jgi:DDE superfamily endonuclease/Helix-turn-helix of DDE superfamily endonuclease
MSIYNSLQTDKQYKASTGLSKSEFEELFIHFDTLYIPKKGSPYAEVKQPVLTNKKEALFFILHYLKAYPTLVNMGIYFNISEFAVSQYISLLKPLLKAALNQSGTPIIRSFGSKEEFEKAFQGVEDIIIDAFEVRIERPENEEVQKEKYSGKKKDHTHKWLIISDKLKNILYIGEMCNGTEHDFSMFKNVFANSDLGKVKIWADLGFQGMQKSIKAKEVVMPHKKPRGTDLTEKQKEENCNISRFRVLIENTIAMIKRYFIARIENRMHDKQNLDEAILLCADLWNFKKRIVISPK